MSAGKDVDDCLCVVAVAVAVAEVNVAEAVAVTASPRPTAVAVTVLAEVVCSLTTPRLRSRGSHCTAIVRNRMSRRLTARSIYSFKIAI